MLSFVPFHLTAIEREPSLRSWIGSWAKTPEFLQPSEWFDKGHDIRGFIENIDGKSIPSYSKGIFVWIPLANCTRLQTLLFPYLLATLIG